MEIRVDKIQTTNLNGISGVFLSEKIKKSDACSSTSHFCYPEMSNQTQKEPSLINSKMSFEVFNITVEK